MSILDSPFDTLRIGTDQPEDHWINTYGTPNRLLVTDLVLGSLSVFPTITMQRHFGATTPPGITQVGYSFMSTVVGGTASSYYSLMSLSESAISIPTPYDLVAFTGTARALDGSNAMARGAYFEGENRSSHPQATGVGVEIYAMNKSGFEAPWSFGSGPGSTYVLAVEGRADSRSRGITLGLGLSGDDPNSAFYRAIILGANSIASTDNGFTRGGIGIDLARAPVSGIAGAMRFAQGHYLTYATDNDGAQPFLGVWANSLWLRIPNTLQITNAEQNQLFVSVTKFGNLGLGVLSRAAFGQGQGVLGMAAAAIPPSETPPNGGGVLFVQNGALYFKGGNGTLTRVAPS